MVIMLEISVEKYNGANIKAIPEHFIISYEQLGSLHWFLIEIVCRQLQFKFQAKIGIWTVVSGNVGDFMIFLFLNYYLTNGYWRWDDDDFSFFEC